MTRADLVPVARDEDTKLIAELRRRHAEVTADRDQLLEALDRIETALDRIKTALGVRPGSDVGVIVARINELRAKESP